jgi:hypothetical protein
VAECDPGQVVMFKGALSAVATAKLAALYHESIPPLRQALAVLAVAATGYGLSPRV